MKVIIAGSRDINNHMLVKRAVEEYPREITEVVSGGARGVDRIGESVAKEFGIPVKVFIADWEKYGKPAGIIRNKQMADYADALIAIWDGRSRGTKNMIDTMLALDKHVFVCRP